jgi:hypothetical protein
MVGPIITFITVVVFLPIAIVIVIVVAARLIIIIIIISLKQVMRLAVKWMELAKHWV